MTQPCPMQRAGDCMRWAIGVCVCIYIYILYVLYYYIYVYIVLGPALRRHVYKAVAAVRVDLASGGVGGGGLE